MRFGRRGRVAKSDSGVWPADAEVPDDPRLAGLEDRVKHLPKDPDLRLQYAVALLYARRPAEAADQALKATRLDRKSTPAILIRAAAVLTDARELDAAQLCAERASRAKPDDALVTHYLEDLRARIAELRHQEKRLKRRQAMRSLGPSSTSSQTRPYAQPGSTGSQAPVRSEENRPL